MDRVFVERAVREAIARMEAESAASAAGIAAPVTTAAPPTNDGTRAGAAPTASGALSGIPVEMSARHIHLSREDMLALFGDANLPSQRAISQPGQYLSPLRVRLIGPKGVLENVAVLGPIRAATQAEISATDARLLGVRAPVNLSGDLTRAATVFVQAGEQMLARACAIIARRHVHMTPEDAAAFGVRHGEEITLTVAGARPLALEGVVVRVSRESALALHIDTDEANAAGAWESTVCHLARVCAPGAEQPAPGMATQPAGKPMPLGKIESGSSDCQPARGGEVTLAGKLITESDVLALPKSGVATLRLGCGQLITPLAVDALKARGMALLREVQA